ncbi:hypothetical protein R6Q59_024261 [Mikania micrantha]
MKTAGVVKFVYHGGHNHSQVRRMAGWYVFILRGGGLICGYMRDGGMNLEGAVDSGASVSHLAVAMSTEQVGRQRETGTPEGGSDHSER